MELSYNCSSDSHIEVAFIMSNIRVIRSKNSSNQLYIIKSRKPPQLKALVVKFSGRATPVLPVSHHNYLKTNKQFNQVSRSNLD